MVVPPIFSRRLELVSLSPEFIAAVLDGRRGEAESLIGLTLPLEWPEQDDGVLQRRLLQMRQDPALQPWLLRALVLRRPDRPIIGRINFHNRPDEKGAVEVGYTILPHYRRQGYATEAVEALFAWAYIEHGVRHFVASVRPDNEASLGVIRKFGFVQTGRQWDEEDGEELVFETSTWTPPPDGR